MKPATARALVVGSVGLVGAAHALPALAAAPVGRALFPTVRSVDGPSGRVGLTFDDGPEPAAVDAFLDALGELGVHATFFLVGEQVRRSPDSARRIAEAGHEIACHGYRHLNHLRLSPARTVRDLHSARDVIVSETGAEISHFRPPFGVFNAASWLTAERLGWNRVLWAHWGRDWEARATPASIQRRLLDGVRDQDILLLHDAEAYSSPGSWRRTLAALAPIVGELRDRGLEPGPLGAISPAVPGATRSGSASGNASGSHPTGNASGSHPTGNASGSHPTGNSSGSHPTGNSSGSHPTGRASGPGGHGT